MIVFKAFNGSLGCVSGEAAGAEGAAQAEPGG